MRNIDSDTKLSDIDPQWAWQPWEPTATERWDDGRVALLFRRAGFCAAESTIRDSVALDHATVIDGFFELNGPGRERLEAFESESATILKAVRASGDANALATWWLHRMLHSPQPLVEKMTLFWHGHFATGAEKVIDGELMYQQNQSLRRYAIGDFKAMVHAVSKDPAMLIYLDSVTNRKARANENFARELMELFCLGEGNYSEADVQELARCFTGWEIRRRQFRFNTYQHDTGTKTLFGQSVQSGEEAVDRVLAHDRLPFFITRKLFRFFVCDEPGPSDQLLEPLAKKLADDDLSTAGVVRTIVGSRLMLSDWSMGRKVRSPVDMAIGLLRTLEATTNFNRLSDRLREVGQGLFYPPNVKGWDGGRAWINSSTLVGRANLVHQLIRDENTRFAGGDLESFSKTKWNGTAEGLVNWFSRYFLAVPLSDSRREELLSAVAGKPDPRMSREAISLIAASPQFHLA
jgi:uncharacterized protein (DUF1800 family)